MKQTKKSFKERRDENEKQVANAILLVYFLSGMMVGIAMGALL